MTHLRLLVLLTAFAWLSSCARVEDKTIITVRGPIPAEQMGITLVHEHVLVDFAGADSTGYHRWDKEEVVAKVMPYLQEVQELGVHTLFECTPAYVGRDPWVLKSLSEKTGMHLVTNTGYYGAHGNHYIPQEFYELSARELAQVWIDEHVNGIDGSGVKPGFIKIAVDGNDSLSPDHVKIITAAALAHQQTGLVIASHTGPEKPAFEQIEVLKSHGIDPSSFIWVHAQRGSLEGNMKAARAGSWVSLDNVSAEREEGSSFDVSWYAERIAALKSEGLLHRVLISHDAGWYSPGEERGGNFRGYSAIFNDLIPALEERGFKKKDVNQLLVKNPVEALSIKQIQSGI